MKLLFLLLLFMALPVSAKTSGIRGHVLSANQCGAKAMVWLSLDKENYQERLLLMHTEVPVGGSFQFYLKPGSYQLRASDEKGCEFFKRIVVGNAVSTLPVKLESK